LLIIGALERAGLEAETPLAFSLARSYGLNVPGTGVPDLGCQRATRAGPEGLLSTRRAIELAGRRLRQGEVKSFLAGRGFYKETRNQGLISTADWTAHEIPEEDRRCCGGKTGIFYTKITKGTKKTLITAE